MFTVNVKFSLPLLMKVSFLKKLWFNGKTNINAAKSFFSLTVDVCKEISSLELCVGTFPSENRALCRPI